MQVMVRPQGQLRYLLPGRPERLTIELAEGSRVDDLLAQLGVLGTHPWLTSLGDRLVDGTHLLQEADEIVVFGPIEGGAG